MRRNSVAVVAVSFLALASPVPLVAAEGQLTREQFMEQSMRRLLHSGYELSEWKQRPSESLAQQFPSCEQFDIGIRQGAA